MRMVYREEIGSNPFLHRFHAKRHISDRDDGLSVGKPTSACSDSKLHWELQARSRGLHLNSP